MLPAVIEKATSRSHHIVPLTPASSRRARIEGVTRPATVQIGRQEQIRVQLIALATSADKLQSATESAYASRDLMKPLVRERETLKQQLSEVNGQVPRDTIKANQIQQRIADCNEEINRVVEPLREFTEGVRSLVKQLKSAFQFLPLSPRAQELRKEIEKLPLLMRGLGDDWTEARDDLLAIRMRLAELASQSAQGNLSLRIEVPPGTKWENIEVRFLSDETVEITTPDSHRLCNFAELGFEDRRKSGAANTAWVFLRELARAKDNEIKRPVREPAKVEKAVQALRKRLKDLFALGDDPFRPYRQVKHYAPTFKLSFSNPDDR